MKIYVFHHAGGSSYSYFHFRNLFPKSFDVELLELPGRGKKFKEKLISDVEEIVHGVFEEIKHNLSTPYIFFGHSMGALVAYLTLKRIAATDLRLPAKFFASGSPAPSVLKDSKRFLLPSDDFWSMLKDIGGIPDDLVLDEEMKNTFEPILRADFQALETYQHQHSSRIDVPIIIFVADQDNISDEQYQLWQQESSAAIRICKFSGDHFYLLKNSRQVIDTILAEVGDPLAFELPRQISSKDSSTLLDRRIK